MLLTFTGNRALDYVRVSFILTCNSDFRYSWCMVNNTLLLHYAMHYFGTWHNL